MDLPLALFALLARLGLLRVLFAAGRAYARAEKGLRSPAVNPLPIDAPAIPANDAIPRLIGAPNALRTALFALMANPGIRPDLEVVANARADLQPEVTAFNARRDNALLNERPGCATRKYGALKRGAAK